MLCGRWSSCFLSFSSTSAPTVRLSSFCLSISPFHKCSGSGSVLPCFFLSPLSQTHTYSPVFPKRLALLNTLTMTSVTRAHSKPCTAHPLPAPPAVSFCFQEPREAGDTRRHSGAGPNKRVPLVFPPSVMDHFCTCFSKAPCVKNSGSVSSHCCKSDLECRADQVKLQLTSPHRRTSLISSERPCFLKEGCRSSLTLPSPGHPIPEEVGYDHHVCSRDVVRGGKPG